MYYERKFESIGPWQCLPMAEERIEETGATGESLYRYDGREGVKIEDLYDAILEAWREYPLPEGYEKNMEEDEIIKLFNPDNIINDKNAYGDKWLGHWFWKHVLDQAGIRAVITKDGAAVYDNELLEECQEIIRGYVLYIRISANGIELERGYYRGRDKVRFDRPYPYLDEGIETCTMVYTSEQCAKDAAEKIMKDGFLEAEYALQEVKILNDSIVESVKENKKIRRYEDCTRDGNCLSCALSSYRRDCRNNPANNLAYYRTLAGLSQSDLAEKVGMSKRTIQDYEQGRREINGASAITVHKLALALGTSIESLLEIEGDVEMEFDMDSILDSCKEAFKQAFKSGGSFKCVFLDTKTGECRISADRDVLTEPEIRIAEYEDRSGSRYPYEKEELKELGLTEEEALEDDWDGEFRQLEEDRINDIIKSAGLM